MCNFYNLHASITIIKTLTEKRCKQIAKWCKICLILMITLLAVQLIRGTVVTIFNGYTEELYLFMLLPFKPDELGEISEHFYVILIILTYYVIITLFTSHTLMLIVFTKISQFAYKRNFDQMEEASFSLPQLSDLANSQLPDKVTSPAQCPENEDQLVQPVENLSTTDLNPEDSSKQIQHQGNSQPANLSQQEENLDSESILDGQPNKQIVPIQQLENLKTSSETINNFNTAEHMEDDLQSITPEQSIIIITEDRTEHPDAHTGTTEANLESCRTYYENISEYVSTIDAFYHFPTGVSLILGTFVACVSLYYMINFETDHNIDFLVYSLSLSSFTLAVCLYGGVITNNAVSLA